MAISYFFSASFQPRISCGTALRFHSTSLQGSKGSFRFLKENSCYMSVKPNQACSKQHISCSINMTAGQSRDPEKINMQCLIDKARKLWDDSPQPVKNFPWNRALENFIQLILDLVISVVKFVCVPLLAVSSLSEMSYCAHEKKLLLVPFPLLVGIVVAGVLRETALELSPRLKEAEVPWHLIAIAIFFTLLKLPGPYYPYWGRVILPHLANGALWKTLWSVFFWYRRPRKAPAAASQKASGDSAGAETI